jgi:hypothetical protein
MENDTCTQIDVKATQSPENGRKPLTLERILSNPVKAARAHDAKVMLGEGCSVAEISRETKLDPRTILKIQDVFAEEIGTTFKKHAAARCSNLAHASLDALETAIQAHTDGTGKAIQAGTLSLIACQLLDKKHMLDGEATTRIEHSHKPHEYTEVDDLYKELQAKKAKESAIDITPEST